MEFNSIQQQQKSQITARRVLLWALISLIPITSMGSAIVSEHSFSSAVTPPSDLARRRAESTGLPIAQQQPGTILQARLSLPEGEGPFPVILLFPNCKGWTGVSTDWPAKLNDWGYAALKVFSLASRPEQDDPCDLGRIRTVGNTEMVFDAVGAMKYLAAIDKIDHNRVAVMGWGIGATGALKLVNAQGFARLFSERASAAVALYPACELHSEFLAPSLVLIGGRDRKHPALFCEGMKRLAEPGSAEFDLVIYPELGHGFDLTTSMSTKLSKDV